MSAFPAVIPTALDFTAPSFPVKANVSLSGVTSRRIFGNRASNAALTIEYDNILDSIAESMLQSWKNAKGTLNAVTLPAKIFEGAGASLAMFMANGGDSLTWHFADAPRITRVVPGYSSVSIVFEATRDSA
jgi:hypothetical protein